MEKFYSIKRYNTGSAKWHVPNIKNENDDYISFTVADSDYQVACPISEAISDVLKHGILGYTYVDNQYLDTVVNWVKRHYSYEIESSWIITSPGVVNSLFYSIKVFANNHNRVLVQTPVYNPFFSVVTNNKKELVENKLVYNKGKYTIDFEEIEKEFNKGIDCFIFCNPHNPVGRVWTKEEVYKIVNLCKKHQVILLSDEIHCDIIMKDYKFTSAMEFASFYDKMIVCTAPSKTFNIAGLQTSNIFVKNSELRLLLKKEFNNNFIHGPNIMGIAALKAAYTNCDEWLEEQNNHIHNNYVYLLEFFNKFIPNAIVTPLEGTYLVWVNLSYLKIKSTQLVNELLDFKIAVNPGETYRENNLCCIRINIATSLKTLKIGLEYLKNYINYKEVK